MKFLEAATRDGQGKLPHTVCDLVLHIIDVCHAPFSKPPPPACFYSPPTADDLSFFPKLPLRSGKGHYTADKAVKTYDNDSCRKASYGHPSLSPGIFTVFCPHGICYGFEVMQSSESPRHPLNIFRHRFLRPPQVIVYDNACKLHQYCLNREPYFFQNTLFVVDRFHWRGHVGCSSGYCLDTYKHMAIKEINSQVNEQANAGLQCIRGQLACMTPENFMFTLKLFLTIKNKDIQRKLDMSLLHV